MQDHNTPLTERKAVRPGELARILGVSRAFGYQLVARGDIRCVRVGRAVLVPLTAVEEFLERRDGSEGSDR